jgi:NAD(P)-dependent dehydrogenase (short-subunit alcohol dehydrogenase family)
MRTLRSGGAVPGCVVVTGAGSGIGLNIRERLLAAGATVAAIDLRDEVKDAALRFEGDITNRAFVEAVVKEVEAEVGPVGGLVNAAGVASLDRDGSLIDVDDEDWNRTLAVNLGGAMSVARAVLPSMIEQKAGRLVHIASVAGLRGMDYPMDAYQVSKAAVVSLSRGIAMHFARDGVRSNTICPGAILTPMVAPIYEADSSRLTAMEARTPVGRIGRPDDVGAAAMFLLSDEADFITGTDLVVDGGLLCKLA